MYLRETFSHVQNCSKETTPLQSCLTIHVCTLHDGLGTKMYNSFKSVVHNGRCSTQYTGSSEWLWTGRSLKTGIDIIQNKELELAATVEKNGGMPRAIYIHSSVHWYLQKPHMAKKRRADAHTGRTKPTNQHHRLHKEYSDNKLRFRSRSRL